MMDIDRFDAVTRILTRSGSRRQALTVAFSGSCGTLTWPDAQEAVAKDCKRIKTKAKRKKCLAKTRQGNNPLPLSCADGQRVCQGGCIPSNQCCTDGDCPASTPSCCGGGCVNILTNLGHCGRCGAGCGFNEQCGSG